MRCQAYFVFSYFFGFVIMMALAPPAFSSGGAGEGPVMHDDEMTVQVVFEGLKFPTSMAFLGPDDILVLEKNEGTVKRIVNGEMLSEPLLKVDVSTLSERGMLGIVISKDETSHRF